MTIQNIKELSKLIDLCRKKGIESISIDNIQVKLGPIDKPIERHTFSPEVVSSVPEYSPEDILHWSSTPIDGVG